MPQTGGFCSNFDLSGCLMSVRQPSQPVGTGVLDGPYQNDEHFQKQNFFAIKRFFCVAVKNIYTHRFRTVEDAGPYGYGGHRQFVHRRKVTAKP